MALVEALVAVEEWSALDEILPRTRAATAGNALLTPFCDRAAGLMTAARGDRRAAKKYLVRALSGFEKLREQYQAARTRQIMVALTTARYVPRKRPSPYRRPRPLQSANNGPFGIEETSLSRTADYDSPR